MHAWRLGWLGLVGAVGGAMALAVGCGTEDNVFPPEEDASVEPRPSNDGGPPLTTSDSGPSIEDDAGLAACATARAETTRQPVYLNLVLDGSGSMDGMTPTRLQDGAPGCVPAQMPNTLCEECTSSRTACWMNGSREDDPLAPGRRTGKRWLAARGALSAYFEAKAAEERVDLALGMHVFEVITPSSSSPPQSLSVPVALLDHEQAALLVGSIAPGIWPDGLTPMRAALESQTAVLRNFSPESPLLPNGRRVIVLITDGVPYGGSRFSNENNNSVRNVVSAALATSPSISTAVIGVGDPAETDTSIYDAKFLSGLAKLGGVSAAGCNESWTPGNGQPCHLQVTPGEKSAEQIQQEISAAIEAISLSVASCELDLDKSSPIDPEKVNVIYTDENGQVSQIMEGQPDGWTYDNPTDPSQVILHGLSCDRLKSNSKGRVEIVIGCPTGTVVVN